MLVNLDSNYASKQTKQEVVVLGSTGSIGLSTLELVRQFPEKFNILALSANSNIEVLVPQIKEFKPKYVVIGQAAYTQLKDYNLNTEILVGESGLEQISSLSQADIIVAAIVGFACLRPVWAAIKAGKKVALANKECLVAAGQLLCKELLKYPSAKIIPVDSEHSAIFQLLHAEHSRKFGQNLSKIVLTASGGPFLNKSLEQLKTVTIAEAVKHPRWNMGAKISVDSASMVNKALELIEAKFLFGLNHQQIDVIIHPSSIVHALIEFNDGVQIAHLSHADMKAAIAYALSYPDLRLANIIQKLDLTKISKLEFQALDPIRFPAIRIARECLEQGANSCLIFNTANEIAVQAFLNGKLAFSEIIGFIENALNANNKLELNDIGAVFNYELELREHLQKTLNQK